MTKPNQSIHFDDLPDDRLIVINEACDRFESALQSGKTPTIEHYVAPFKSTEQSIVVRELLTTEIELGRPSSGVTGYLKRFPEIDSGWIRRLVDQNSPKEIPSLIGDYQIVDRLGGGGMGTVYRAKHVRMKRMVALKLLREDLNQNANLRRRFEREVQAAARLNHPNIVTAYDAGESDDQLYLVTELIDGKDLNQVVRDHGPLDGDSAIRCVLQTAIGLQYAHDQGVCHRDIKPANLLVDDFGHVKILDLGLARLQMEPNDNPSELAESELTKSSVLMGTAAYMAPEQARDTRVADERSDIYSLGGVLFFLINGRAIYSGETFVDTILAHATLPIPRLGRTSHVDTMSDQTEAVYRRCVAKSPDDRFQTAGELVQALRELLGDQNLAKPIKFAKQDGLSPVAEIPTIAPKSTNGDVQDFSLDTRIPAADAKRTDRKRSHAIGTKAIAVAAFTAGLIGLVSIVAKSIRPDPIVSASGTIPINYGLRFNGSSSYVAVANMARTPERPLTIEIIVKVENPRVANVVSWFGPKWTVLFGDADSKWGVGRRGMDESDLIKSNRKFATTEWQHVAGIWDGRSLSCFVDGNRVSAGSMGYEMLPTESALYIGGFPPRYFGSTAQNDRFFAGIVDAVRISEGVRYTDDFRAPQTLSSDDQTVCLFTFDEGDGTTVADQSDNRHVGTIVDATWTRIDASRD